MGHTSSEISNVIRAYCGELHYKPEKESSSKKLNATLFKALTDAIINYFVTYKLELHGRTYEASLEINSIKPIYVREVNNDVGLLRRFFRALFDLFVQPLMDRSCTSRTSLLERELGMEINRMCGEILGDSFDAYLKEKMSDKENAFGKDTLYDCLTTKDDIVRPAFPLLWYAFIHYIRPYQKGVLPEENNIIPGAPPKGYKVGYFLPKDYYGIFGVDKKPSE